MALPARLIICPGIFADTRRQASVSCGNRDSRPYLCATRLRRRRTFMEMEITNGDAPDRHGASGFETRVLEPRTFRPFLRRECRVRKRRNYTLVDTVTERCGSGRRRKRREI